MHFQSAIRASSLAQNYKRMNLQMLGTSQKEPKRDSSQKQIINESEPLDLITTEPNQPPLVKSLSIEENEFTAQIKLAEQVML